MNLLVVGERVNAGRKWPKEREAQWHRKWEEAPLAHMRLSAGLQFGPSRRRLEWLTGLDRSEFQFVNLLPPSAAIGSWDAAFAARCANVLVGWISCSDPILRRCRADRVLLLGKKVAAAWPGLVQGQAWVQQWLPPPSRDSRVVPVLEVPHPSGRNRIWNDPEEAERWRTTVADFLR